MKKADEKQVIVKKNPTRQKIVVAQGRQYSQPIVDFKVIYTEIVADIVAAKERVKELKEEYKETDALSVNYFSL